jgi:hypothetical protein
MSVEINESVITKLLSTVDAGLCSGMGQPVPGQMCVEAAVCYSLGLPHSDDPGCVSPALRLLKIRLNDCKWSSTGARAKGLRRLAVAQLGSKDVLDEKRFVDRVVKLVIQKNVAKALRQAAELHADETHKLVMRQAAYQCEREGTKDAANNAANAANNAAYAAAYNAAYAANAANNAAYAAAYNAAYAAAYNAAYAANAANNAAYAAAYNAANNAAYAAAYAAYAANNAAYAAAYAANNAADAAAHADERDKVLAEFAEDVVQILTDMDAPGCKWLAMTEMEVSR